MIIIIFFLPLLGFSNIIQDDVSVLEKNRHSFKYVCEKSGYPDSPLIEIVSGTKIDCMSKKIDVGYFCDKEMAADPYYLRAYVDKDKKEVVCVSGKKVFFKYVCSKNSDQSLCNSHAKDACIYIQNKLAKRLDLVESLFSTSEKGLKQLQCSFESLPLKKKIR